MEGLKKAVEGIKKYLEDKTLTEQVYAPNINSSVVNEQFETLLALAERTIAAQGVLPEKQLRKYEEEHFTSGSDGWDVATESLHQQLIGFDKAIDACLLTIAGKYVKVEDLPKVDEVEALLEHYLGKDTLSFDGVDSGFLFQAAQAISDLIKGVGKDGN